MKPILKITSQLHMAICIYKTDINWYTYLRNSNATEVYFWRSRLDKLGIDKNEWFYFLSKEEKSILGRGKFRYLEYTTVEDSWLEYGQKCGSPNFNDYKTLITDVLNLEKKTSRIQGIFISNVQWLPENKLIPIQEKLFKSINAQNPFRTDSIPDNITNELNNKFTNIIMRKR